MKIQYYDLLAAGKVVALLSLFPASRRIFPRSARSRGSPNENHDSDHHQLVLSSPFTPLHIDAFYLEIVLAFKLEK